MVVNAKTLRYLSVILPSKWLERNFFDHQSGKRLKGRSYLQKK